VNIYYASAALLLIAAALGIIAQRLKQPLMVAYIVTGVIVGPNVMNLVGPTRQLAFLAEIGVTVLLFIVGLKLDMRHIRSLGRVAFATGTGQIVFSTLIGYLLAIALGMDPLKAAYVATALTFSSTIIIVKLLSDKRELDSLHGRISMGFLIVQDLAVLIAMTVLGALRGASDGEWMAIAAEVAVKLLGAAALVALLMRYVLPRLIQTIVSSQELMLIFALAWGTALATAGEIVGFTKEVGALLAGFSLASSGYREAISARLTSVRDFLLLFFFVDLGAKFDFSMLGGEMIPALILTIFVLIGKPLIVMAIVGWMGYRKRTGFLVGVTSAQISEFSIIFIALGITLGHIGIDTQNLVTFVGLCTIAISTYMVNYAPRLYGWLEPGLGLFERKVPRRDGIEAAGQESGDGPQVIVYGLGRYGSRLLEQLEARGVRALGVDFDPVTVHALSHRHLNVRFGDAEDPDFPQTLPLAQVRWVVSTLLQSDINLTLIHALREQGYRGAIAVAAHGAVDAREFHHAGVRVLQPFRDAADFAAEQLAESLAEEALEAP
jgi:Kef-type K+ transport system membrane component KefB